MNEASGLISILLHDNLEKGSLKIFDMDNVLSQYETQSTLAFKDESGANRTFGENLFIELITDGSGAYTVYTVAIPEPATYAIIFGAITFGFVAYRKRK